MQIILRNMRIILFHGFTLATPLADISMPTKYSDKNILLKTLNSQR